MTHHPIRTRPDGTRVYSNFSTYKPLTPEQRKYKVRKPDDPRAVRWKGDWFLPLEFLADARRVLPETRPDTEAYDHMKKPRKCRCYVCLRPESEVWKKKWQDERGLKPHVRGPDF